MKETMAGTKKIADGNISIFRLVDDPETIVRIVRDFNRNEELISYNHQ